MQAKSVQKLIEIFAKFPTVGPRTAARFVYYLIGLKKDGVVEIANAILELKKNIKTCSFCFNPFEPPAGSGHAANLCEICSNPIRDKTLLCIVEKETDLNAIEKIKKYAGRYFILGGTVSRLRKAEIEKLRIKDLVLRVKNNSEIKEIILAINPTAEGEATTLYLERLLKPFGASQGNPLRITRLGLGLPVGGELEYADEETLSSALERRR